MIEIEISTGNGEYCCNESSYNDRSIPKGEKVIWYIDENNTAWSYCERCAMNFFKEDLLKWMNKEEK